MPDRYVLPEELQFSGRIKQRPEDYNVTEVLAQKPSGTGPNTFIRLEKRDISTLEVVHELAQFLERRPEDFCVADYKDRRSVAIQWISLEHLDPRTLERFNHDNIRVIKVTRNPEKLKPVNLEGNRFEVTVRDIGDDAQSKARRGLRILEERGVPNWFETSWFGSRQTNHLLGWALITKRWEWFLHELLDRPDGGEGQQVRDARNHASDAQWEAALERFPDDYITARQSLESLVRYPDNPERAVDVIPSIRRQRYLAAFQAFAFNAFLEERLETYDELLEGDVAFMHETAGCFPVVDPDDEQPRMDRFEISPTGPLYGEKFLGASDDVGELEDRILEQCELTYENFQRCRYPVQGRRRPLRVPVSQISLQTLSDDAMEIGFFLPRNSYASVVFEEFFRRRITETVAPV